MLILNIISELLKAMILFAKVLSNPLFIFYKENPFSYDQDMVCEKNFDRMSVSGSVAQGRCNQAMMVGICKMMKSDFLCPFLLSTVTYRYGSTFIFIKRNKLQRFSWNLGADPVSFTRPVGNRHAPLLRSICNLLQLQLLRVSRQMVQFILYILSD